MLQGLVRLEDLVHKINDSLDNRVEANLQAISKMRLVDLPVDRSFTYEDFVATQAKFVKKQAEMLAVKWVALAFSLLDNSHLRAREHAKLSSNIAVCYGF